MLQSTDHHSSTFAFYVPNVGTLKTNTYLKAICNKQPLSQGFCYNFKNEAVEVKLCARNKQDKSKVREYVLPSNTVKTNQQVQYHFQNIILSFKSDETSELGMNF